MASKSAPHTPASRPMGTPHARRNALPTRLLTAHGAACARGRFGKSTRETAQKRFISDEHKTKELPAYVPGPGTYNVKDFEIPMPKTPESWRCGVQNKRGCQATCLTALLLTRTSS